MTIDQERQERMAADERERLMEVHIETQRLLIEVTGSERYAAATFTNYTPATPKQASACSAAKLYATCFNDPDADVGPLILAGPPGVGKTHLAAAILEYLIRIDVDQGYVFRYAFIGWHDFIDIAQSWPKRDDGAMSRLVEAGLLIVDDLQVPDDRTFRGFEWLVEKRYRQEHMGMVITANLSPKELRAAVGDRAFDRLQEGAVLAVMDGPSYRAKRGWRDSKALESELKQLEERYQ